MRCPLKRRRWPAKISGSGKTIRAILRCDSVRTATANGPRAWATTTAPSPIPMARILSGHGSAATSNTTNFDSGGETEVHMPANMIAKNKAEIEVVVKRPRE